MQYIYSLYIKVVPSTHRPSRPSKFALTKISIKIRIPRFHHDNPYYLNIYIVSDRLTSFRRLVFALHRTCSTTAQEQRTCPELLPPTLCK